MRLKVLKSFNGDSLLLSFVDENGICRNILIDGGVSATYSQKDKKGKIIENDLFNVITSIRKSGQKIDLLILTHVDDDHIGGILKWFENDNAALDLIECVWFNSGKIIRGFLADSQYQIDYSLDIKQVEGLDTSIKQGITFEQFLEKKPGLWDKQIKIATEKAFPFFNCAITIISPDRNKLTQLLNKWSEKEKAYLETSATNDYDLSLKEHILEDTDFIEDTAVQNGSSISVLISYGSKNILFLADAHPSVIVASLRALGHSNKNPIECEVVKLSHHGSKSNNSLEMLRMINSSQYIISTNGDKHAHPHKRLIARIVNHNNHCKFYFNYPEIIDKIINETDKSDFPDVCFQPIEGDIKL